MSLLIPMDLLVPVTLGLGTPLVFAALLLAAKRWAEPSTRRHPLAAPLLRLPAHGLREQRDQTMREILLAMIVLAPLPLLAFVLASTPGAGGSALQQLSIAFTAVGFIAVMLVRLARQVVRLRRLRLGWEAEVATAQELDRLVAEGWQVYHDMPGEGPFNVDHVAIGPAGVFAIETKGRAKRFGKNEHRVEVDGDRLVFPNGVDTAMVAQARRQARWLSGWLSKHLAQPIGVEPVLCILGWWLERKTKPSLLVTNSASVAGVLRKARGGPLDAATLDRIGALLDARCRDVKLGAFDEIGKKAEFGSTG